MPQEKLINANQTKVISDVDRFDDWEFQLACEAFQNLIAFYERVFPHGRSNDDNDPWTPPWPREVRIRRVERRVAAQSLWGAYRRFTNRKAPDRKMRFYVDFYKRENQGGKYYDGMLIGAVYGDDKKLKGNLAWSQLTGGLSIICGSVEVLISMPAHGKAAVDDIDVLRNQVAVQLNAKTSLVDSWLPNPVNAQAVSSDGDSQPGNAKQSARDDTKESLAALARSQRAGVGKLNVGSSEATSLKKNEQEEDLITLKRQLRLGGAREKSAEKSFKKAPHGQIHDGTSDESEEEGRSRFISSRKNHEAARPQDSSDSASAPGLAPNHREAMGSSLMVPKRKATSFLDEVLERNSKKSKNKKKAVQSSATATVEAQREVSIQAHRDFAFTGDSNSLNDPATKDPSEILLTAGPAPARASLTEATLGGDEAEVEDHNQGQIGNEIGSTEQPNENEEDRRRRKNREKKLKFKQKQQLRRAEKLEAG
ncbi:MAG: hypothetical protein Q9162_001805 [Coniocarpon cinnabarinum]